MAARKDIALIKFYGAHVSYTTWSTGPCRFTAALGYS